MLGRLLTGAAGIFGGMPIWLWVIGGLLVALTGVEGLRRVQTAGLRADVAAQVAGRATDRAEAADAAIRQATLNAAETERRLSKQQENQSATNLALADAARDRDAAQLAAAGLQRKFAEATAALGRAARDPAAGPVSTPADPAAGVLADVFGRINEAAGIVGAFADTARIAGLQCERDYGALRAAP